MTGFTTDNYFSGIMRVLLLFLFSGFGLYAEAAELQANVTRQQITLGDHLQVNFQLRGATPQEPDFSPLQQDFEILSMASGSRVVSINRDTDRYYEWQLTLTPKHTGTLTLPPIEVAGARSEAVEIQVDAPQVNDTEADTFLQVSLNKSRVYVQEEVLLTLKLYSKVQWRNKAIASFDLPDTLVKAVAENEYVSNLNGTPHLVYELTLALYPQKSGTLTLPALQYDIEPSRRGRSMFSDFYGTGERLHGISETLSIQVDPTPGDLQGPWLPARKVTLSEHFSHDRKSLKAGEPITRRITLRAEGLSETQLPELPLPELEGFNFYRDQAQIREEPQAEGVISERVETIAMVPTREGRFILPAVEVRWWNTDTEQFEIARLEEKTLQVSLPANYIVPAQADSFNPAPVANSSVATTSELNIPRWLPFSQALTAALLLLFIGLWWRERREKPSAAIKPQAPSNDQTLWRQLKQASANNDLVSLRECLLAWFNHTEQNHYHSLEAIAQQSEPELAAALRELDKALFSPEQTDFNSGALLQKIQLRRIARRDNAAGHKLPDLYPPKGTPRTEAKD